MAKVFRLASMRAISNGALNMVSLPTRLKVLDWGLNKTLKGDVIVDDTTVQIFNENQQRLGRERAPIDFDHNSVRGTDAHDDLKGKPPTIFGYGTPTVIPGDGVYFENIVWTPDGEANARNFHDLSPTPLLDESNRVLAIHSCALTPAGAVEGLTFYSAFATLSEHRSTEGDYCPPAYKETLQMRERQGLLPTGSMNNEHFNYYKKVFRLDPNSSDEAVKKHVLKTFAVRMLEADASMDADADADAGAAIRHMAAMFGHVKSDPDPNNKPYMNQFPSEGGPVYHQVHSYVSDAVKPFEARITALTAEIAGLKEYKSKGEEAAVQAQRDAIMKQASVDGKVIGLSAESIAKMPVELLKELVEKTPKATVPIARKAAFLSAEPQKKTRADAARAMQEDVERPRA